MDLGHGGPNLYLETIAFPATMAEKLREYVHLTTNMLVDSRISLFVIYPGLSVGEVGFSLSAEQAQMIIGDNDPFSGDINFGLFSNETGSRLFYNRNDVDAEIKRSEQLGAIYYTLTYQPDYVDPDGKFPPRARLLARPLSPCRHKGRLLRTRRQGHHQCAAAADDQACRRHPTLQFLSTRSP